MISTKAVFILTPNMYPILINFGGAPRLGHFFFLLRLGGWVGLGLMVWIQGTVMVCYSLEGKRKYTHFSRVWATTIRSTPAIWSPSISNRSTAQAADQQKAQNYFFHYQSQSWHWKSAIPIDIKTCFSHWFSLNAQYDTERKVQIPLHKTSCQFCGIDDWLIGIKTRKRPIDGIW